MNDNIIEVKNLKKTFGTITAVNNISFTVKGGSLFAFLGLNGAGKSTTINILCSILSKDSGSIKIAGIEHEKHVRTIKKMIGIVFQDTVLDQVLTVKENLKARSSLYGLDKQTANARLKYLVDILDLKDLLNRRFKNLSGGQKRRVDIARALIHDPKILFLDEPTTGLDPTTRLMVWQVLKKLQEEKGLTIFLTTHYMEEATVADKIVIIDNGNIVAEGSPDELKHNYTSDYIRIITPPNDDLEAKFKADELDFTYRGQSYFIKIASTLKALEILNRYQDSITIFEVLLGDMDDVFLNVTGRKLTGDHHAIH